MLFYSKLLQFLSDFSDFLNKKPRAVYSLWPSEVLAMAMFMNLPLLYIYVHFTSWPCCVSVQCACIYHLSFPLCVYANEWLFVGVFSCLFFCELYEFSLCALLIVFTDFASLILHSIQFWSMHFMWLRFFLLPVFTFPALHINKCVFSVHSYTLFCVRWYFPLFLFRFELLTVLFELQFSFLTVCNEKCTYAIVPAAHKNHQTVHLARHASRKKAEVVFKAASGNVIIIKYL